MVTLLDQLAAMGLFGNQSRNTLSILKWQSGFWRRVVGWQKNFTLPETNMAPENGWLEY